MKKTDISDNFKHFHHTHIDSTNNAAKQLCNNYDFFYVTAESQSSGKGRLGNVWISDSDSVYLSIVFPLKYFESVTTRLSILSALSVYNYLQQFLNPIKLRIKWPNDILYNNSKISGILIESHDQHFIIGVGININQDKNYFIKKNLTASSLHTITAEKYDVKNMYSHILNTFIHTIKYYNQNELYLIPDYLNVCQNYRKKIKCRIGNTIKYGYFLEMMEDGSIILETDRGKEIINSGEIIE